MQTAIADENRARNRVLRHTPAQIEAQLGSLAFSDIAGLFDENLQLRPLNEIAPEDRAAIVGMDVQEFHDQDGKVIRRIHRIKLEKKGPPLETLGKIHGLIKEAEAPGMDAFQINIHLEPLNVNEQVRQQELEGDRAQGRAIETTATRMPVEQGNSNGASPLSATTTAQGRPEHEPTAPTGSAARAEAEYNAARARADPLLRTRDTRPRNSNGNGTPEGWD